MCDRLCDRAHMKGPHIVVSSQVVLKTSLEEGILHEERTKRCTFGKFFKGYGIELFNFFHDELLLIDLDDDGCAPSITPCKAEFAQGVLDKTVLSDGLMHKWLSYL